MNIDILLEILMSFRENSLTNHFGDLKNGMDIYNIIVHHIYMLTAYAFDHRAFFYITSQFDTV